MRLCLPFIPLFLSEVTFKRLMCRIFLALVFLPGEKCFGCSMGRGLLVVEGDTYLEIRDKGPHEIDPYREIEPEDGSWSESEV